MSKKIPAQELDAIAAIVASNPDGARASDIREGLDFIMPPRMLQRRLVMLANCGRITVRGTGKGTRYFSVTQVVEKGKTTADPFVPISPEAETIRQKVRAPVQARQPVGYNREFLDAYTPNETFYLPAEIRQRLRNKGDASTHAGPAGTYVRTVFNRLLIDLSWNSSRLEGNTYSLLETERLLDAGEPGEGKKARETQMILNHKAAIELLVDDADTVEFDRYTILNLHALLSDNLLEDQQACGRLRTISVGIGGTVFYPLDAPQLIDELFDAVLHKAAAIRDPFEQSFFALVQMPYPQPFDDVNKRVSRLAANIPLVRENLCPLSFVDVPKQIYIDAMLAVYELNRIELLRDVFVWAYERSCTRYSAVRRSLGEPNPFRLQYRTRIGEAVSETVRHKLNKREAISFIRHFTAEHIPPEDGARFIEMAEIELMSLHDGNIARYRLRPSEYQQWKQGWR